MNKDLNRIKVMLAEKKRTNKWLAEQLGKDPSMVSKWCSNRLQPNLESIIEIARLLEVDVQELIRVPQKLRIRTNILSLIYLPDSAVSISL